MKLTGQIVLITGSSRGLGAAIARAFHREGAKVVINYVREESAVAAASLSEELGNALIVQADVGNESQVHPYILIYNAKRLTQARSAISSSKQSYATAPQ
jgi:NAD(P)-dependent dehydrogenase (short-subunit alcohol dehydrogenase family)